jgi:uncharacterized protein YprB with RNaseH-like and TPR domain
LKHEQFLLLSTIARQVAEQFVATQHAYLDIETTFGNGISVIGIYRSDMGTVQLVGGSVNDLNLYQALHGVDTICTYNGSGFDLPVIRRNLRVDLRHDFRHYDLMYACRKRGLRGGLKKVELQLGIVRSTVGISGWDALRLWQRYEYTGDRAALELLLRYNRDDIIYLPRVHAYIDVLPDEPINEAVHVWE